MASFVLALQACAQIAGLGEFSPAQGGGSSADGGSGAVGGGGVGGGGVGGPGGSLPPGQLVWSRAFGSDDRETVHDVAVDSEGNIIVVGLFVGSFDFDTGDAEPPLVSAGSSDVFVAKLAPDGSVLWQRHYGGTQGDAATAVAITATDDIVVAGWYSGSATIGGQQLTPSGQANILVFQLSADGDTVPWALGYAGATGIQDIAYDVAVRPDGDVLVVGDVTGDCTFGSTMTSATSGPMAGDRDFFALMIRGDGMGERWARRYGSDTSDHAYAGATNSGGHVLLAGVYGGPIDLGLGSIPGGQQSDAYVLSLFANGSGTQHVEYSNGPGNQIYNAVAVDSNDAVVLGGEFVQAISFDGGGEDNFEPMGPGSDGVLVKYETGGTYLWSMRFGESGDDTVDSVAIDNADNVLAVGRCENAFDGLNPCQGGDIVVLKLDGAGSLLWLDIVSSPGNEIGEGVAVAPDDSVIVVGTFEGADLDLTALGGTIHTWAGGTGSDIVVMKLAP